MTIRERLTSISLRWQICLLIGIALIALIASLAITASLSLAFSEITDLLGQKLLTVGLIVLCVAGLVAFLASGRITAPLEMLTAAANQIAAGDLETELPKVRPLGEVKALYGSIGEMTSSLRQMIDHASAQEARTQAIFNSTADALVTIDERGNLLSCNETTEKLFGIDRIEMVGKKASLLVPALYDENVRYKPSDLTRGETRQVGGESDVVGYHRDGRELPISLRVTEMDHLGERLYIATMQDITERKQAEQQREDLFTAIRDAVSRLAAGTQDILATTTQQSTGAQQQAAAVSQTVATVNEVAQTADQAAQRAGIVAEAAKQAETVGKAGRKAVEQSVASMDTVREQVQSVAQNILSLAERAQAIGEIIATVSDIAEQTNVLALNAAVEASRAGEHGKGFAVVASEVKALAEQSKKATRQVRQILGEIQHAMNTAVLSIEKGTSSVDKAGEVVGQTGDTIRALEEMLSQSARTASQISASSGQQATGVIQLNEAIKNIDRVTQQNVEAIQQIEASAHSLNALSNELAGLTS
ncbi:MAG TPA: methyl-accepting chemotaxis protein [Pirellulaceae bacterium]|nr:methyl-accepting chemotaxis protein [Pirellulaceae bacterium]